MSVFPPLNDYLKNILTEASELLETNKLRQLELRIMKDREPLQSFIFKISEKSSNFDVNIEDCFRNCICLLENRCKMFKKVAHNCTFKVFLHVENYEGLNDNTKNIVSISQLVETAILFYTTFITGLSMAEIRGGI